MPTENSFKPAEVKTFGASAVLASARSQIAQPVVWPARFCSHFAACAVLLTLLIGAYVSAASAETADLEPHRAIYNVSLAKDSPRTNIVGADGKMFYRIAASCDGWTVENRTVLRLVQESGTSSESVWTFSSWESREGNQFQFAARYEQDGETIERFTGRANLNSDDRAGQATFSQPADEVIELPAGTLFPTEHVRVLIEAARNGQRFLARPVFDGASVDNPYLVNALIAPLAEEAAAAMQEKTGLDGSDAWRAHMAFFPLRGGDNELPEFEISAHYRQDGVADHIIQTFDTFALQVDMAEFERLPKPDC